MCFTYAAMATPAIAPLLRLLPLFEFADAALFEIGEFAATVGDARLGPWVERTPGRSGWFGGGPILAKLAGLDAGTIFVES